MSKSEFHLHFPHESPEKLKDDSAGFFNTVSATKQGVRLSRLLLQRYLYERRFTYQNNVLKEKQHRILNGDVGTTVLQDKHQFVELVAEMGYNAPASVLIPSGSNPRDYVPQVMDMDKAEPRRFCKPHQGVKGKGIFVASDPQEAIEFVSTQKNDYLVQTFEYPEQDWRYILHRDNQQITEAESPVWRIAYEKIRPTVTGDGVRSIQQLVADDILMPSSAKKAYMEHDGRAYGSTVLEPGESTVLINSGNLAQGAYGKLPETKRLEFMDAFMNEFLVDLEKTIGGRLGTLCVDLGIKNTAFFDSTYDIEELKKSITFYEFQVPFGFQGYIKGLSSIGISRLSERTSIMYSFGKSMLLTGARLHKNDSSPLHDD